MKFWNGKMASGGNDGNLMIWDTESFEVDTQVNFGGLIRAIDHNDNCTLVGLRDGSIKFFENDNIENMNTLMESHADGEIWGLDLLDDGTIITSADDNSIMRLNPD